MAGLRDDLEWGQKCSAWIESQAEHTDLIYAAAEPYANIYKAYHKKCLPAMAAAVTRHLDPDDNGGVALMKKRT